jgi:hypothetical protein
MCSGVSGVLRSVMTERERERVDAERIQTQSDEDRFFDNGQRKSWLKVRKREGVG